MMNCESMKKYIKIITIQLCSIMYLALGGSAFAITFYTDEDRIAFCIATKPKVEKMEKDIKVLEKNTADKSNAEKIKTLKAVLEQAKIDMDQAPCNDVN